MDFETKISEKTNQPYKIAVIIDTDSSNNQTFRVFVNKKIDEFMSNNKPINDK